MGAAIVLVLFILLVIILIAASGHSRYEYTILDCSVCLCAKVW
ncbi:hypothetical protein VQL36_02570 [Chengkuizengella sp. SCS-71B]